MPATARVPRVGLRPPLLLYLSVAGTRRPRQLPPMARHLQIPLLQRIAPSPLGRGVTLHCGGVATDIRPYVSGMSKSVKSLVLKR